MKIRKLIVISPLGLALLAALILAWWFLGDDAWIKGKIEDTVSEMTGRSLSIDGDFAPDWSTSPVLTAEKIHFSNPRENGRFQPERKLNQACLSVLFCSGFGHKQLKFLL
jgi:uncharacterized protein involved in outer membrane biogenesis